MTHKLLATALLVLVTGCSQSEPQQEHTELSPRGSGAVASNAITADSEPEDFVPSGENVTDFKIRLELESQGNASVIEWDKPFRIVWINHSERPIRIWDPNSGQGFNQIEVHFRNDRTGAKHVAKRRVIGDPSDDPEFWIPVSHNFGSESDSGVIEIPAQDRHVTEIALDQFAWGLQAWTGLPNPNTNDRFQVNLRFESKPGEESRRAAIWTGRQASEAVTTRFTAEKLKTPHKLLWDRFADAAIDMMSKEPAWIGKVDGEDCTPLHHAARFGPASAVQWLLDHDADVNALAYNGFTPLHLANDPEIVRLILTKKPDLTIHCRARGQTPLQRAADELASASSDALRKRWRRVVDEFRNAGAEYDALTAIHCDDFDRLKAILQRSPKLADNFEEQSLLRTAASLGRVSICEYLVTQFKVDVDDFERGVGYPIIKEAVRFPEIAKLLIDHGADLKTRITWRGGRSGIWIIGDDATALHYAANEGVSESIKLLIDGGVDVFATAHDSIDANQKQFALEVAAIFGRADNAETILKHPKFASAAADIRQPILDKCLQHGAFPTWLARGEVQRVKLLKVLLEAGANPNVKRDGVTPLQIAARAIHPTQDKQNTELKEMIALLRKHGAKLDLFSAVAIGDVEQVRTLLTQDPKQANARGHDGYPAIHFAIGMDYREIVTELLKAGCDLGLRNKSDHTGSEDETPLHAAAFWGRNEIAAQLINAKADINALDEHQFTPLHDAARVGNLPIVKLLIESGAKLDARDKEGKTPLDLCEAGFGAAAEVRRALQEAISKGKR